MADLDQAARNSVALQREMFRLAEHEHGLSVAVIARTRNLSPSTVKGWRDGAAMPAWAIGALRLPDDLTSLVLSPYAKHVGTDEEGDADPDDLARASLGLAGEVAAARDPNGPGGSTIVPMERERIRNAARQVCAKARAIAA